MKAPTRRPPAALVGPAGLAVALVVLPIIGLLQRAPWSTLIDRLTDDDVLEALQVSVVVSVVAATVATVLGLPLAWILARHHSIDSSRRGCRNPVGRRFGRFDYR